MVSVELSAIAERLRREQLLVQAPASDAIINGITDNSRAVSAGALFCAWRGTTTDSHAFVAAAEENGAVAALVEHVVAGVGIPQLQVSDGRRAAAVAANHVFGDPASKLIVAGVTGTNGKTTTAWIMRHLLAARHSAALMGTLGIFLPDGKPLATESLTTPGPVELARMLAELVARGVAAIAMEVSSHALDQGRVQALRFDAAVFTNFTRDHLDYHGTLGAYLDAKKSFVELLRKDGSAVINADDPAWRGLEQQARRTLRFSLHDASAELRATDLALTADGTRFVLIQRGARASVQLPLLGDFNVQNALAAAGAALSLGFSLSEIARLLQDVPQVPGRLERIHGNAFTVLRDYAHTPDALERVLLTLRPLAAGRLIVVFGAGGDRDKGKRPLMGGVVERLADLAVVTSDNPRTENPEAIIDDIVAGMKRGNFTRLVDRRAAIAAALEEARAGDVVLLAGKGHETYQILGRQKVEFDERVIVRDLLDNGAEVHA